MTDSTCRDRIVFRARFFHLYRALHAVHHGGDLPLFEGTLARGRFVTDDGQGGQRLLVWNEAGVVALTFDPTSSVSELALPRELRTPEQHLTGAPPELTRLIEEACDAGERLATAGAWAARDRAVGWHGALAIFADAQADEVVARMIADPETRDRTALAQALASAAPGHPMTDAEQTTALRRGDGESDRLVEEHMVTAVAMLEQAGIEWPGAVQRVRAIAAARRRAQESEPSDADLALLRAAEEGDRAGARAALASGARIDCQRSHDRDRDPTIVETPLVLAARHGHTLLAQDLVFAGVAVDTPTDRWAAPIGWAAWHGDAALCRLLLERGARVRDDGEPPGRTLLDHVASSPSFRAVASFGGESAAAHADVVSLLLDAGAPMPNDMGANNLIAAAEAAGALDLVPRLRAPLAPDVLPLPRPRAAVDEASVSSDIERAAACIDDLEEARRRLADVWRISRHPRVADAVDRIGLAIDNRSPGPRSQEYRQGRWDVDFRSEQIGEAEDTGTALHASSSSRRATGAPVTDRGAATPLRLHADAARRRGRGRALAHRRRRRRPTPQRTPAHGARPLSCGLRRHRRRRAAAGARRTTGRGRRSARRAHDAPARAR